jgi:hypothetical protein
MARLTASIEEEFTFVAQPASQEKTIAVGAE